MSFTSPKGFSFSKRIRKASRITAITILSLFSATLSFAGSLTGAVNEAGKITLRFTMEEELNAAYVGKLENGENFRFNQISFQFITQSENGYTYRWESDINYDPNVEYDFFVQANSASQLHYAPGNSNSEYMRFEPFLEGKFTPPGGETLFVTGQDIDTVNTYVNDLQRPLAGVTSYIAADGTGAFSRFNDAAGPLDLQSYLAGYPDSVISLGAWMVGKEELIAARDPLVMAQLDANLEELKNSARPIFLRLGYEVDGKHNHYEPAEFLSMWYYVHDWIETNNADNIAMVWQLAAYCRSDIDEIVDGFLGGHTHRALTYDAWWPGEDYVDWTGFSYFEQNDSCKDAERWVGGLPPEFGNLGDQDAEGNSLALDNIMAYLKSKGKPIFIAEAAPRFWDLGDLEHLTSPDFFNADNLISVTAQDIWEGWFEGYFAFLEKYKHDVRATSYINMQWDAYDGWRCIPGQTLGPSNCGSGYWGDSRVQAQPYILERWLIELDKDLILDTPPVEGFDYFNGWSEVVTTPLGQAAYTYAHEPHAAPGIIEAEDFDVGGEGIAYHDVDPGNNGYAFGIPCRTNENVDVGLVGQGGCSVGWTAQGEWLEYTVDFAGDGEDGLTPVAYDVTISVALPDDGAIMNILIDGVDYAGDFIIPNTGDWGTFRAVTIEGVEIPPGVHVVRVEMTQGGVTFGSPGSLDYIEFRDPGASSPYNPAYAAPIPGKIEIEHFNQGKKGSAFNDLSAPNQGGINQACDRIGVAPEDKAIFPVAINPHYGECAVMSTTAGEWMEYTVQVAETAEYDLTVRAIHGNNWDGIAKFSVSVDGENISGNLPVPTSTPAWEWVSPDGSVVAEVTIPSVALTAGIHNVRIHMVEDYEGHTGLFDYMEFIRSTPANNVGQTPYQTNTLTADSDLLIEAGLFDLGGENVAWNDSSDIFHLGPNGPCRNEPGVDGNTDVNWFILTFGGIDNCSMASFFAGEWVEYTIEVDVDGVYGFSLLNDTGISGSFLILDIDGQNILPMPLLSSSTNWGEYVWDSVEGIELTAGTHIVRVTVAQGGFNIHKLVFTAAP